MAWILPAMVLTAVWLWKGGPLGYALAGALLSFLSLLVLATAVGIAEVFGVVFAISLGMVVWYLRDLKEQ